jgi:hypothetical protein
MGVTREEILGGGRRREISEARAVLCYVCLRKLGLTGRHLSEALDMSPGGVHSASVRGEAFVGRNADLENSLTSYFNNSTTSGFTSPMKQRQQSMSYQSNVFEDRHPNLTTVNEGQLYEFAQ